MLGDAVLFRLTLKKHLGFEYVLIDDEDFDRVSRAKWSGYQAGKNRYARATSCTHVPSRLKDMHRFIMWAKPGQVTDHVNGDTHDNRKQNLRFVTRQQNSWNSRRPTFPGKTSRFKGVAWDRHRGGWLAGITFKGERHDIGYYDIEEHAAHAYDKAALICFDEYARTNAAMKLFEMDDPFVPNLANTAEPDGEIPDSSLANHSGFYFGKTFEGWGDKQKFRFEQLQHYLVSRYGVALPEPPVRRVLASRHAKRKIERVVYPR